MKVKNILVLLILSFLTISYITGAATVCPQTTKNYDYDSNFLPSGNIVVEGGKICSETFLKAESLTPSCTPPTYICINQTGGACKGDTFSFGSHTNGSSNSGSYQWSVGNGAVIISGQGTRNVRVASPPNSGFLISVTHTNNCQNTTVSSTTLAQFSNGC